MTGYKYYKINRELYNAGYTNDIKCTSCNGNIRPNIQFPYRTKDVFYTCDKCDIDIYFKVEDVIYTYASYNLLNKLVNKYINPGECKDVTAEFNEIEKKIKIKNLLHVLFFIFIVGFTLFLLL